MIVRPNWLTRPDPEAERLFRCRLAALYRGPSEPVNLDAPSRHEFGSTRMTPPAWVKQADSDRARLNFLVRLAALYASPKGTLSELAKMCGYNPRAMSTYAALETGRATVSPALAKAIEAACGGVVTRAQLNSVFED